MREYVNVGSYPVDLEDGSIVPPGDRVMLANSPLGLTKIHVDEGRLQPVEPDVEVPSNIDNIEKASKPSPVTPLVPKNGGES